MALTLRKAGPADITALVEIYFSAFSKDAISLRCFPRTPASFQWWHNMLTSELTDPDATMLVITTSIPSPTSSPESSEKEEIIAWCKWNAPSSTPLSASIPQWPADTDVKLANHFFGSLFDKQIAIMGQERKHWYLELLATKPEWQGKGAAGKLMRWGLEMADEKGEEVYIEASPDGRPIYEHFGFKEVERLVVDLEGLDPSGNGEKEFVEVLMRRSGKV